MERSERPSTIAPRQAGSPEPSDQDVDRLLRALQLEKSNLPPNVRAALEALGHEVLALRLDQIALKAALERSELFADRDALCPVFNRRAFERELTREIALASRYGTPLCVVFLDLDRFKLVNDRFGHATGDTVLTEVCEVISENIRQTDILGRLGGDEFGIALTHADLSDCQEKAKSITALIDEMTVSDASKPGIEPVKLGASCGVVSWRQGKTATALIAEADETMFRTKALRKSGRV